jgi:hypothetical protein
MNPVQPRRGFFAKLLALAVTPIATKVAAALPAEAPHGLDGAKTSVIDQAKATALARAWTKGLFRIEPYVPHEIVYAHNPPSDYFFFFVDRGEGHLSIGASETIAVRKSDGQVSHCGWVGE